MENYFQNISIETEDEIKVRVRVERSPLKAILEKALKENIFGKNPEDKDDIKNATDIEYGTFKPG